MKTVSKRWMQRGREFTGRWEVQVQVGKKWMVREARTTFNAAWKAADTFQSSYSNAVRVVPEVR